MNKTEVNIHNYLFLESTAVKMTIIVCQSITLLSSVVGVLANLVILCCIVRQNTLQTYINASLANASIVNIIACTVLIPKRFVIIGMYIIDGDTLFRICESATFFRCFCEIFQLSMLVAISYERYQAVLSPFEKSSREKRVVITIIISWIIAITYGGISSAFFFDSSIYIPCSSTVGKLKRYWATYDSFISFPFGCVAFSSVLIFYICIFRALQKQTQKMQSHSKVRKRKVHPVSSLTIDHVVTATSNSNLNKLNSIGKQHATQSLFNPESTVKETPAINEQTKTTEITDEITKETTNKLHVPCNFTTNKLPSITNHLSPGNSRNFILNGTDVTVKMESTGTPGNVKNHCPPTPGKASMCDENIQLQDKSDTYDVYDADGTVRTEKRSDVNVVGAVCMFTPKNRELGKRKLEAKIAKNIAIGIGLFGLVWAPLPLYVVIIYNVELLSELQYRILTILSSISTTIYMINPLVSIFMNKKIQSECIKILQGLKILRKT